MKPEILLFSALVLIFILHPLSLDAQADEYNYSVKNRWTVKASYSRYKTAFWDDIFAHTGDNFLHFKRKKMSNFKVETNYGINKFIETGIYIGFQHYEWLDDGYFSGFSDEPNKSFAPLFGVNANFHILPFLVKSKECRWDVYLTAKYGGCYLPHLELDNPYFNYSKYRHEYGLGLGVGYYFKNIIGLFAEGSLGEYFYFYKQGAIGVASYPGGPMRWFDSSDSNFRFRIGIAAKF
jgi:hypothetical protein